MNYLRYDQVTGKIMETGWADDATLFHDQPDIIFLDEPINYRVHKVNVDTLAIEPYTPPPPPPPPPQPEVFVPPMIISDRQFFQQAAIDGYITQADALAAVQTGFIPLPLQSIVDQIVDPNEQFAAEMLLSGATTIYRDHPLVAQIGAAFGMTSDQIDTFFTNAMAL